MDKIIPTLWFDDDALEAVELYVSVFKNSRISVVSYYYEESLPDDFEGEPMPDGTVMTVDFEICGQRFSAVNGGSIFRPNPSISFYVVCESAEQLDRLHEKLVPGGSELMALGEYPFAKRYSWLEDRFGVSWQLILGTGEEKLDPITPCLLFMGEVNGRAHEAMGFYCGLFENSGIGDVSYYGKNEGGDEGTISHAEFHLAGQSFVATDSSAAHEFEFSEGVSLMVQCKDQEEIDYFWGKLTDGGKAQPCGWVKDKYGVSWQVIPEELGELMDQADRERAARVSRTFLEMTKVEIEPLRAAYRGTEAV